MTTLQLARAIADAVLATTHRRRIDSTQDAPTQAVLATLRRTGTWFIREPTDDDGLATQPGSLLPMGNERDARRRRRGRLETR